MKNKAKTQNAAEVVEQLEENQIDIRVVRYVAGDTEPSSEQRERINQLRRERGDAFYSDLMFALMSRRYPHHEAHNIWNNILSHRKLLTRALARNPGIVVSALDYLTNSQQQTAMEFSLIESGKLETVMERAVVDGLTSLYDHDTLFTLFEKEIERAKRHNEKVALLLLDLDDFKHVNDKFGHQKGDQVLSRVAEIIRNTIRTMDIAGRYGGEEFAVILPEADRDAAINSAERLREAVQKQFQDDIGSTISIGVGLFPDDGDDIATLVKAADKALYDAKARGKNRVVAKHV